MRDLEPRNPELGTRNRRPCYHDPVQGIDLTHAFITLAVLLISLSIHEAAHAWSASVLGDPTARVLGRVSLNPLVHIDPIGTILFPLIGLISGGVVFGWAKPVPVNTLNLRRPRQDHLLIAAAGPVSNLLQAVFCLLGLHLFRGLFDSSVIATHSIVSPFFQMLYVGLMLNVILAVFNLFPIPPLDGSWVLQGLLPENLAGLVDSIRPYGFMLLLLLLFSGVFSSVLGPILGVVGHLVP